MAQPKKVIFAGTPEFASIALSAIIAAGYDVVAVYTQPDRPAGRGKKIQFSDVKQVAIEHQIPVEQPLNFKQDNSLEQLQSYQADVMVVAAYGIILPQAVLDSFEFGCINIHGSLLPRWRGAAPIQRAICAGDKQTGITIMQMDKGLDTGNMLLKSAIDIADTDTGSTLHDKLALLGASLCVDALGQLSQLIEASQVQDDNQANYAHKLSKQEAEIDWAQDAIEIARAIRAYNSWPVSYTSLNDKVIKVWSAEVINTEERHQNPGVIIESTKHSVTVACKQGAINIIEAQLPNSKKMPMQAILNSKADWFAVGTKLG
jgi:methionyl-tRNA formyltransferase